MKSVASEWDELKDYVIELVGWINDRSVNLHVMTWTRVRPAGVVAKSVVWSIKIKDRSRLLHRSPLGALFSGSWLVPDSRDLCQRGSVFEVMLTRTTSVTGLCFNGPATDHHRDHWFRSRTTSRTSLCCHGPATAPRGNLCNGPD